MFYGDALIMTEGSLRSTVTKEFETKQEAFRWKTRLMHKSGVLEIAIADGDGDLLLHIDSEWIEEYKPDGRLRRKVWRQ